MRIIPVFVAITVLGSACAAPLRVERVKPTDFYRAQVSNALSSGDVSEGVESELVVHDSRSTQANPHTVAEVRRILLEHLKWVQPNLAAAPGSLLQTGEREVKE